MKPTVDNLEWLAFCYLSNDLDDGERAAFEDQLATNQQAREALADLVGRTQAIAAAHASFPPTPARTEATRSNSLTLVSWSSCLALLVVVAAMWCITDRPTAITSGGVGGPSKLSPVDLAVAWAETRDTLSHSDTTPATDELLTSLDLLDNEHADDSLVAPSWMLAALGGLDDGFSADPRIQE